MMMLVETVKFAAVNEETVGLRCCCDDDDERGARQDGRVRPTRGVPLRAEGRLGRFQARPRRLGSIEGRLGQKGVRGGEESGVEGSLMRSGCAAGAEGASAAEGSEAPPPPISVSEETFGYS